MSDLQSRESEELWVAGIAGLSHIELPLAQDIIERTGLRPHHLSFRDTAALYEGQLRRLQEGRPCGAIDLVDMPLRVHVPHSARTAILARADAPIVTHSLGSIASTIRKLSDRRSLMQMGEALAKRAKDFNHEPEDVLAQASADLEGIVSGATQHATTLDSLLPKVADEIDTAGQEKGARVVRTGIKLWDQTLGGLHPTLTIIGAKPSRGKSGLAATLIFKLAERGIRSAIFSLEDRAEWLLYRKLAHISRIPQMVLKTRELNADQQRRLGEAWGKVQELSKFIIYDDRKRLSPEQVVASARHQILNLGAQAVWLDHLSEMRLKGGSAGDRHDLAVTDALMEIRALADSHKVPVIVLTHLKRESQPPHSMEDFKNSSGVEMAARQAVVLDQSGEDLSRVSVTVVKNMMGPRDVVMPFVLDEVSAMVVDPDDRQGSLL